MFRHRGRGLKIGIVTTDDPHKGLWRDAECLGWALEQNAGRDRRFEVSLFPIPERDTVERDPEGAVAARRPGGAHSCASPGTRFADWLDGLHALVSCEYMMPRAFDLAVSRGIRAVYVPNLDWAVLEARSEDTGAWTDAVRRSGAHVWARTPAIGKRLRDLGVSSYEVPWSIPDPVVRERKARPRGDHVRFFMNAGTGGFQNRRGVDIALKAFREARRQCPAATLTIKTIRPLQRYLTATDLPVGDGVEVLEGFSKRSQIAALYGTCDGVVHPSRWEGFGLALLEALHAGAPVLVTDGWPMNELVVDGRSGMTVRAEAAGWFRLAPRWECEVAGLSSAMVRLAEEEDLRQRLSCGDCDGLAERQRAFVRTVQRLLDTDGPA
jgi:glycosyltransferase involved in cell wall biosynthesis